MEGCIRAANFVSSVATMPPFSVGLGPLKARVMPLYSRYLELQKLPESVGQAYLRLQKPRGSSSSVPPFPRTSG